MTSPGTGFYLYFCILVFIEFNCDQKFNSWQKVNPIFNLNEKKIIYLEG